MKPGLLAGMIPSDGAAHAPPQAIPENGGMPQGYEDPGPQGYSAGAIAEMAGAMPYAPSGVPPQNVIVQGPEPTGYLREMLRFDDYLDYIYHLLRGDYLKEFDDGRKYWVPNLRKLGEVGGPMAGEEGLRIIMGKLSYFLSKFAAHAALTVEQAHGYAYEAANEMLYFVVLEGESYQVQTWARSQLVLMVDVIVFLNLTRTIGGSEAKRIGGLYQAREFSGMPFPDAPPSFFSQFPGTRK